VVTLTVSATFLLSMGVQHLQIVAGLLIGGMMAAPVAAILVKRVKSAGCWWPSACWCWGSACSRSGTRCTGTWGIERLPASGRH
jgi:hypothetical protein